MLFREDENKCRVENFIDHFAKELDQIERIEGQSATTLRGALAVSLLDALSISVSAPRQPRRQFVNRDRFIDFVRSFSDWPDGNRISLPHLVQLLRRNPSSGFEAVRRKATDILGSWIPMRSNVISIDKDPLPSEFKADWPRKQESQESLEGISLEQLTHYNLFWVYRNGLVHELRTIGHGIDTGDYDFPHYHELTTVSYGNPDDRTLTIELVYPAAFVLSLCRTALSNLHSYLMRNKLDPYEAYRFGTYWITELNSST